MRPLHAGAIIILFALALLLWLLWSAPTMAQVVDMKHPETGEDGAWIPRWVQQDHLKLEADLKTCTEADAKRIEALEERKKETADLRAALAEGEKAKAAQDDVIKNTNAELELEREENDALRSWLYGTSSIAVLATVVAVILTL